MAAESYQLAGVNIEACDSWLASLQRKLPAIGGFGGIFPLGAHTAGMSEPCLVAGADGVGTKVLVAMAAGDLTTVGIDCVAMVVNDLICCGARPLFFLDYLAVGRFEAPQADAILSGLIGGCEQAGCTLLGGETAELPGLFPEGDFDVAGFGIGLVDRGRVIDGSSIAPGDVVVGLSSSGIHSNGLSLARRALPEYRTDPAVARELLTPTLIYVKAVMAAIGSAQIRGIAHITGGGLPGNLSRVLPSCVDAALDPARWACPAIFERIAERGVAAEEMYRTFNMGIGMCLVVDAASVDAVIGAVAPTQAQVIGEIVEGRGKVQLKGVTP